MLRIDSPVGPIEIVADSIVRVVRIGVSDAASGAETMLERETALQLDGYFQGDLNTFDLPLPTSPAPMQEQVWQVLDTIPFGTAVSYGHIARELGLEAVSARAVGGAVGANPTLIVRPCHRVLGADGSLTGYAGGLDAKLRLLQHEGVLL